MSGPDALRRWLVAVLLLLAFWGTRIARLETMPLHNDEGLHLRRAVEVWHSHPFWDISDGKIINHWAIALFDPRHAPVFAGRIATVLISLLGLAAGLRLSARLSNRWGALLAGLLWLSSAYLFFYERLALSDAEAGAFVVLALLGSVQLVRTRRTRLALLTGLFFGLATLFKLSAAPFALMIALVVLLAGRVDLRRRLAWLMMIGATAAACFVVPVIYLLLTGRSFFSIALGWVGVGSQRALTLTDNIALLWDQLTGFSAAAWLPLLLAGLIALLFSRRHGILLAAALLPALIIVVIGREVMPRHFVVALPLLVTLAGVGWSLLLDRLNIRLRRSAAALAVAACAVTVGPFMLVAYEAPGALPVPAMVRRQYLIDHSAGFGLREAVQSFPQVIERRDLPIIGSMFPDGCRRANFYAAEGLTMQCGDAPGLPQIEAALAENGAAYVLTDHAPLIGVDVTALEVDAALIGRYPRPGETDTAASVVLWLLEAR